MKKFTLLFILLLAAAFIITPNDVRAQNDKKKEAVTFTADELKWTPIPGGTEGAMSASLWGDAAKEAHGGFIKFPAGFKAPMHNHSSDTKIIVVKGAYVYNGKKYGPGSYLFIPGGLNHESGGAEDSESIFFSEQPGSFDLVPAQPSK